MSAKIHAIHRGSRESYVVPRIHAELADDYDIHVNQKARRALDACGEPTRCRAALRAHHVSIFTRSPADLSIGTFRSTSSIALVLILPMFRRAFLFLHLVRYVSRIVVSINHLKTHLVLATINMRSHSAGPRRVIHHSDHARSTRASPSASAAARWRHAIRWFVGDAYDNAMPNRFSPRWNVSCSIAQLRRSRGEAGDL